MATATLRNVGNSVAVVIPKQWLAVLGLEAGVEVELTLEGQRLTLQAKKPTTRKKYTLNELLQQCDNHAPLPDELKDWESMKPVGNELW